MTPRAPEERPDCRRLSFWHDSMADDLAPRAPLEGDTRADVAIVGAGYTGLWTAWHLKQLDPSIDIAIVEAGIAGTGASGRNGGWCAGYLSGIDHWIDDPTLHETALRLQRLMFRTVGDIGRVTAAESIDCHYERSGALEIAVNPAQLERLERAFERVRRLGFGDGDYRWLGRDEIRRTCAVEGALAAVHFQHCAAIHPARLARGLADRLCQRGVKIYERSPARACAPGGVDAGGGRVLADTVIVATEGYGAALPGRRRALIPVHSMMVVTEPLPSQVLETLGLGRRYCFGNLDRIVTYGQLTADRRIAFGCRGEYYYGSAVRHRFDGKEPGFERVRSTLLRFFPALQGLRFTHAWGGALGVARSLRPQVRFDPDSRIGWAGGYFGNGVAAAHLAGQTLADLVAGRDSERVRTPWVNAPGASRAWEPEPLRWLGFRATRLLMGAADRAEYRGGVQARRFARLADAVLP